MRLETLSTVLVTMWAQVQDMVAIIAASAILLIPVAFMVIRKTIGAGKSLMGIGGGRRR